MNRSLKLSAVALLCAFSGLASASLVVKTDGGLVQGFTKAVPGTKSQVEVFLGVPYAAAPVGPNRWEEAKPVQSWTGVKSADWAPPVCKQPGKGSEDCLYVNIYRPANMKKGEKLPVGVYAHGGANIVGGATEQDGSRIASENHILYLTVQYRMGAFGFLSLPGMGPSAGNFGITDTEAALRWVRKNIANFGGDPKKVTLVTESAGSTNACRILGDQKAKGIVDRVVLQSEDCIHDVDTPAEAKVRADKFLKAAGCDSASDALACLKKLPSDKLAVASASVGLWNPVSETTAASQIEKGNWIRVPVLSGSNKEEGRSGGAAYVGWGKAEYEAWVNKLAGKNAPEALKHYPADKYTGKYAIPYVIGDFITDSGMRGLGGCTNLALAEDFGKTAPAAWIYTFEDSTVPTDKNKKHPDFDNLASHASELTYFYPDAGRYFTRAVRMTPAQKALAKEMRAYWGNFVKTGNPNSRGLPTWKPFKGTGYLMALRLNGKSKTVPASYFSNLHQCSFWNSIPVILDRGDR